MEEFSSHTMKKDSQVTTLKRPKQPPEKEERLLKKAKLKVLSLLKNTEIISSDSTSRPILTSSKRKTKKNTISNSVAGKRL